MRKSFHRVAASLLTLALASCQSCPDVDRNLKNVVIFHYEHVANVREIHFARPLQTSNGALNFVQPLDQSPSRESAFWAVFVICSLDVEGTAITTFQYDTANFVVEYGDKTYTQPLKIYTLREQQSSISAPNPGELSNFASAINSVVQLGPDRQSFPPNFHTSLNYRVAILIPEELPFYAGEQLTLKYIGQPSLVQGSGRSPIRMQSVRQGDLPSNCG
jgi:hypothetical protein